MRRDLIEIYCGLVGRELLCLPETKQELLSGLRTELSALPLEDTASVKKLEAKYGKVSTIAAELQEAVSFGERSVAFQRQRKFMQWWMIGSVILIVLLLLLIVILLYAMPLFVIECPME